MIKEKFDNFYDRSTNDTRKWNKQLISEKFSMSNQVIPMDIADLDFEVAEPIKQAIIKRAQKGDYSYTFVTDTFYEAVINWSKKRFNSDIKKEWIKLEYGTVPALYHLVQIFSKVGESVLINTPVYDPFYEAINYSKRNVVVSSLINNDGQYMLDFKDLEEKLALPTTQIYIFCNPHNPSGRVWHKKELYRVAELCLKHKVLLIVDEVHRDLVYNPKKFTSVLSLEEEFNQNVIVCVSPNKAFNLGGLKTSYLILPDERIREETLAGLKKFSVTSPNVFALPAIITAYEECEEWLDEMLKYIQNNFNYAKNYIAIHMPKFNVMDMSASFLLWLDVHEVLSSDEEIDMFFQEINVTLVKGSYFVKDGEGFVRLNIGCTRELLEKALKRIKVAYDQNESSK